MTDRALEEISAAIGELDVTPIAAVKKKVKKTKYVNGDVVKFNFKFSLRNLWHGLWVPHLLFFYSWGEVDSSHSCSGNPYFYFKTEPKPFFKNANFIRKAFFCVVLSTLWLLTIPIRFSRVFIEAFYVHDKKFVKKRNATIDAMWSAYHIDTSSDVTYARFVKKR